jgi:transcriptional regulator with XRE-family HTH domain
MAVTRERVMAKLRELRRINGTEERPLSQEEAAHRADITVRQWQRWEAGESMPYTRNLSKVAEKFDVSLDYFDEPLKPKPTETPDLGAALNGSRTSDAELRQELADVRQSQAEIIARLERLADAVQILSDAVKDQARRPVRPPASRRAANG